MKYKHIHLHPGGYHASDHHAVISTILGSCVAACLFDPGSGVFGMNHFMLSSKRYSRDIPYHETEAGRYGIHAMELLINRMISLGASRYGIRAKAFGGASILPSSSHTGKYLCVGDVNVRFIREFLAQEGIALQSEDLGGGVGRVIRFYGDDFSVYVKKMQPSFSQDISAQEKKFWEKSIKEQKKIKADITIWE